MLNIDSSLISCILTTFFALFTPPISCKLPHLPSYQIYPLWYFYFSVLLLHCTVIIHLLMSVANLGLVTSESGNWIWVLLKTIHYCHSFDWLQNNLWSRSFFHYLLFLDGSFMPPLYQFPNNHSILISCLCNKVFCCCYCGLFLLFGFQTVKK